MKTTGNFQSKTKCDGDECTQSSGGPPIPVTRLTCGKCQEPSIPKQSLPKYLPLSLNDSWHIITTTLLKSKLEPYLLECQRRFKKFHIFFSKKKRKSFIDRHFGTTEISITITTAFLDQIQIYWVQQSVSNSSHPDVSGKSQAGMAIPCCFVPRTWSTAAFCLWTWKWHLPYSYMTDILWWNLYTIIHVYTCLYREWNKIPAPRCLQCNIWCMRTTMGAEGSRQRKNMSMLCTEAYFW